MRERGKKNLFHSFGHNSLRSEHTAKSRFLIMCVRRTTVAMAKRIERRDPTTKYRIMREIFARRWILLPAKLEPQPLESTQTDAKSNNQTPKTNGQNAHTPHDRNARRCHRRHMHTQKSPETQNKIKKNMNFSVVYTPVIGARRDEGDGHVEVAQLVRYMYIQFLFFFFFPKICNKVRGFYSLLSSAISRCLSRRTANNVDSRRWHYNYALHCSRIFLFFIFSNFKSSN